MSITVTPRARVIIDNDFAGDPDDLFQTAHHLLCPAVEIPFIIGSHLRAGDPWHLSPTTATEAVNVANELLGIMGMAGRVPVLTGSEVKLDDVHMPQVSKAAEAIVAEAMRDDVKTPLYYAAGGGLTDLASAWLMEPRKSQPMWSWSPAGSGRPISSSTTPVSAAKRCSRPSHPLPSTG